MRILILILCCSTLSFARVWQSYTDDNVFYLYFTSVADLSSSNDEAENICAQDGYKLLEIENEAVQQVVDRAMMNWENPMMPLLGYLFRLNIAVQYGDWIWMDNTELDYLYTMDLYPNFAYMVKNNSGIYFHNEFERIFNNFICSYPGSCISGGDVSFADGSGSCIAVFRSKQLNWFQARSECLALSGDLVTVSPQNTWTNNIPLGMYWIGLAKARYVWKSTGRMITYSNWKLNEPLEGWDCTFISQDNTNGTSSWRTTQCNDGHPYVCMSGAIPIPSRVTKVSTHPAPTPVNTVLYLPIATPIATIINISTRGSFITTSTTVPVRTILTSTMISDSATIAETVLSSLSTSSVPLFFSRPVIYAASSTQVSNYEASFKEPGINFVVIAIGFSLLGALAVCLIAILSSWYFRNYLLRTATHIPAPYDFVLPPDIQDPTQKDPDCGKNYYELRIDKALYSIDDYPPAYNEITEKDDSVICESEDNQKISDTNYDADVYELHNGSNGDNEGFTGSDIDENLYEGSQEYETQLITENSENEVITKQMISHHTGKNSIFGDYEFTGDGILA